MVVTKGSKLIEKRLELRGKLWPDVKEDQVWSRKRSHGFTTIPRSLPLMMEIMDDLSPGKPLSRAYLTLWCRVWDEGFITINNSKELAFESGFSGQRAERTWVERMRTLRDLGFINPVAGGAGEFNFVLLPNPYQVIVKLKKKMGSTIHQQKYTALLNRAIEIGAKDIEAIKV